MADDEFKYDDYLKDIRRRQYEVERKRQRQSREYGIAALGGLGMAGRGGGILLPHKLLWSDYERGYVKAEPPAPPKKTVLESLREEMKEWCGGVLDY